MTNIWQKTSKWLRMGPRDDFYDFCSIWFRNTLNLLAHFCSHFSKIIMHAPIHIFLLRDNWLQLVCMYVCMYLWEAVRGPARARDRVATVGGRGVSLSADIVVFVRILALSNADTFAVQGCWQSWVQISCFFHILAFLSGGPIVFTRILTSFRQILLSLQWLWHPCRCRGIYNESGTLECACVCFTKILPPLDADCVFFARILRFRMQIIVFRRILVFLIADTVVFATGPIRCPCGKRPPAPQPQPLTVNDAGFGACCRSRSQAAVHPWRFRPDLGNVIKIWSIIWKKYE
jgi:hypothetical protein